MSTKLFVGNLSFNTTQEQLQDLFAAHGNVVEVDVIMDKFSGRPRGFGFVTMESKEAADASFKAFRDDPTWVSAKKASEENAGGSLTAEKGVWTDKGVDSVFMKPTDYSQTK